NWWAVVDRHAFFFFFSSRRRHTRCLSDWSSDVCSSDLVVEVGLVDGGAGEAVLDVDVDVVLPQLEAGLLAVGVADDEAAALVAEIGRASCRERVWSAVVGGGG